MLWQYKSNFFINLWKPSRWGEKDPFKKKEKKPEKGWCYNREWTDSTIFMKMTWFPTFSKKIYLVAAPTGLPFSHQTHSGLSQWKVAKATIDLDQNFAEIIGISTAVSIKAGKITTHRHSILTELINN